jgi:RNA polymerase sigma factor (sigma-70 family)
MNCCDRAAFEDAFAVGTKATIRFLVSKGCTIEQSEEISQAAWMRAWKHRENFQGGCKLTTWVMKIALNLLRTEWRRKQLTCVEEPALGLIAPPTQHDLKILVGQLLALMDPRTRRILTERYLEGREQTYAKVTVFHAVRKARRQIKRGGLIAKARLAASA